MTMDKIQKVTVTNVTATVNKETGKVEATGKNKWCLFAFTSDGNMPLAAACMGMEADKDFKKYLGVYTHSRAVVLAHKFAVEFGKKESSKVTDALAAAQAIVDEEDKVAKEKRDERKAHPELVAARKFGKAVEGLQKAAVKSANLKFKRAVVDISKKSNDMLAQLESEVAAAEDPAQQELEKAMKAA